MFVAAVESRLLREQRLVDESGDMVMEGADAGREAAVEDRALELRRRPDLQGDMHVGPARLESADGLREPAGGIGQRVVDDTQLQVAHQLAAQRAGAGA